MAMTSVADWQARFVVCFAPGLSSRGLVSNNRNEMSLILRCDMTSFLWIEVNDVKRRFTLKLVAVLETPFR